MCVLLCSDHSAKAMCKQTSLHSGGYVCQSSCYHYTCRRQHHLPPSLHRAVCAAVDDYAVLTLLLVLMPMLRTPTSTPAVARGFPAMEAELVRVGSLQQC